MQSYKVRDFPWTNQDLPAEIVNNAIGLDLFIGNSAMIGKGWGTRIMQTFLDEHVFPLYQYCIVDPDINNIPAIRCYTKLGFKEHKIINSQDALHRPVQLTLMLLKHGT